MVAGGLGSNSIPIFTIISMVMGLLVVMTGMVMLLFFWFVSLLINSWRWSDI